MNILGNLYKKNEESLYMPCYISNNNPFKKELTATIKSLEGYPNIFKKIKLFICQKDKRKIIQELVDKLSLRIDYEIIYIQEGSPRFLPMFNTLVYLKKVLKPVKFDVSYVIHLSQNSYI